MLSKLMCPNPGGLSAGTARVNPWFCDLHKAQRLKGIFVLVSTLCVLG